MHDTTTIFRFESKAGRSSGGELEEHKGLAMFKRISSQIVKMMKHVRWDTSSILPDFRSR